MLKSGTTYNRNDKRYQKAQSHFESDKRPKVEKKEVEVDTEMSNNL